MNKKLLGVLVIIGAGMIALANFSGKKDVRPIVKTELALSSMEGKSAPDFSLPDQRGKTITLSSLRGEKVILFFNEGIMCYPACWNQMAALGTDDKLNSSNVKSYSIVTDKPDQWDSAFKKMPELNQGNILFDSDKEVSIRYGMLSAESSMHRGSMPGHTYLILDQKGIIRYTLDDPNMGIQNTTLLSQINKI